VFVDRFLNNFEIGAALVSTNDPIPPCSEGACPRNIGIGNFYP
jgi:hypothetical protein